MRFVDASVFLYAYLKPKRATSSSITNMKLQAKNIVARINAGERVFTSVIHLSEVANILEAVMPLNESRKILKDLTYSETIEILASRNQDFSDAIEIAEESNVGVNDAVASILMRSNGISEVYSFDTDFDGISGIKRITH